MRGRTLVVPAIVAVVSIAFAALVVTTPRTFYEVDSLTLTAHQSPAWTEAFCLPDGTLVSFAWHTSDASTATVRIWSTGELGQGQYAGTGGMGVGRFYFVSKEVFSAEYLVDSQVQVRVELSFSLNGTYLAGPPTFGLC